MITEYSELTKDEKRIYNSVMLHFPQTSHDIAMDVAISGGVRFDFNPR